MTPAGIEPATCQFVAQCLNHYATARPSFVNILNKSYWRTTDYIQFYSFIPDGINVVCNTLHTGGSRVLFPMVSLEFFSDIILLVALWPWGRISP